jgi:1-acyl-sn-glycerol-3-phosphate acyltransferase
MCSSGECGCSTYPRAGRFCAVLYRTLELSLAPLLRVVFDPVVAGAHHVPRYGPVIIASNHVSFADEIFTPLVARRQVSYFAKAEYFTAPGLKGRAMAALFSGLGQVPVERADTRSAAGVIDIGVEVLRSNGALGIFPEGTRSPDGSLYKFRTGVARLALRTGAPVIPVGIVGTREVLPPEGRRWRRAPVTVSFGAPLYFGDRAAQERSARVLREVTDTIRVAIQGLSGQPYIDAYASSAKPSSL